MHGIGGLAAVEHGSQSKASSAVNRWRWLEPAAWCALALAVAWGVPVSHNELPRLTPDSTQYLSAADCLRALHHFDTYLLHYDTERSHGTIPAPLTWYPPGYPSAIALLSALGLSLESAALWISLVSFAMVTVGIFYLTRALCSSPWAARAGALCWIASSHALFFSEAALSEALFTLLGVAGALLMLRGLRPGEARGAARCWIGSVVLAGLSYWVRYAGALWIVAFLAIISWRAVLRKKGGPSRKTALAAAAAGLVTIGPIAIRNLLLAGDWKGGNNTPMVKPIGPFLRASAALPFHLLFGDAAWPRLRIALAVAAVSAAGLFVVLLTGMWKAPCPAKQAQPARSAAQIVVALAFIYSAGMAWIAFHSVVTYDTRMYLPVLPHLICLLAAGIGNAMPRAPKNGWQWPAALALTVCLVAAYCASNWISLAASPEDSLWATRQALRQPGTTGVSVEQRLVRELRDGEVIAATNGQLAGYALHHPALSLVSHNFSKIDWDDGTLRSQMVRFGASRLLVFRDPNLDPVLADSPLLSNLAQGRTTSWLDLESCSSAACVYRISARGALQ